MYVLNRKQGERIKIGDTYITVLSKQRVKLGIISPPEVRVERLGVENVPSESNTVEPSKQPDPAPAAI